MTVNVIVKLRILFWCTSVSVLLFSYFIVRKNISNKNLSGFLISSAFLTALILFDDFFYIHHFIRKVLHISNTIFYLLYPAATIIIIKLYNRTILETEYFLIIIAYCFLGLGVIVDLLTDGKIIQFQSSVLLENLMKISGSLLWMIYFYRSSFNFLKQQ